MLHHRRHKTRDLFDGFTLAVVGYQERGHRDVGDVTGHDLVHGPRRGASVHVPVIHESHNEVRPVTHVLHDAAFVRGEGNGHNCAFLLGNLYGGTNAVSLSA